MKPLYVFATLCVSTATLAAEEKGPLDAWLFPNATMKEHSAPRVSTTSADGTRVTSVASEAAQYVTEKPFHEVVAFYVRKSGLTPPNWSILGRKFPGTDVHLPAHWVEASVDGEKPFVTILHYIRENIASAQVLITGHPELGNISISIIRGKDDKQTLIQMIQHPSMSNKQTAKEKVAR